MTTFGTTRQGVRRRGLAIVMLLALGCPTAFAQSPQPGAGAAAQSSPATGSAYQPGDFLTLDLNSAVLSPRPLGPATRFAPFDVEAKSDTLPNTGGHTAHLTRAPTAKAATASATPEPATSTRHAEAKPRAKATVRRVAVRRHRNPLDAQAFDARPQSWPCRGNSGICAWR